MHSQTIVKRLQVDLAKTEIVVSTARLPVADSQGALSGSMRASMQVQVADSFRYLGVWLHSTKSISAAREALKAAGQGAIDVGNNAWEAQAYAVASPLFEDPHV